jgi:surface-adhesin protein E
MPFTIRPYRCFPVHCAVTYKAGLFLKLPLAYFWGFGLLITLLLFSSGPAFAEWAKMGETQSGITVYADLDTIRKQAHFAKWWELYDLKTKHTMAGDSFLSIKMQREFDCAEERTRTLAFLWYSGNMGSGEVVYSSSDESKWDPVAPDTIDQTHWKFLCGKQ